MHGGIAGMKAGHAGKIRRVRLNQHRLPSLANETIGVGKFFGIKSSNFDHIFWPARPQQTATVSRCKIALIVFIGAANLNFIEEIYEVIRNRPWETEKRRHAAKTHRNPVGY